MSIRKIAFREILFCAFLTAALAGTPTQAKPTLILKNLRATVEIIPENRSDFAVTVNMAGAQDKEPLVAARGDSVTVEGVAATEAQTYRVTFKLDPQMDIEAMKRVAQQPRVAPANIPHIDIRAPMNLVIRSNGQIFGHVGPSQSLTIKDNGRGEWAIDKVERTIEVESHGSANVHVASAGVGWVDLLGFGNITCGDVQSLYAANYGAGNITVGHVQSEAMIGIGGIGDFTVQSISGTARVDMDDAGNVHVLEGNVAKLTVRSIDGSGTVTFDGSVQDADISIGTSTVVHLREVTGKVKKTTRQMARLEIDNLE